MKAIRRFRSSLSRSPFRRGFTLQIANINPKVIGAEYAVRGEIVIKAEKYKQMIAKGDSKLPFSEVVSCNIGNPQELEQKPITFFRQVLALCTLPSLMDDPNVHEMFSQDSISKAKEIMKLIPGGSGAYSHSMGIPGLRKKVADFIERRDGYPSDPNKIFLTDGASSAVQMCLQLCIRGAEDGVMVPIPQYPLYSASIALHGGTQVNYYLDEKNKWSSSIEELRRSYNEAKSKGIQVRSLVIINPGNPTGQCLEEANMREILSFCQETGITLMADEVYQTNIYAETPFTSFKKVLCDMGEQVKDVTLVSFHSVSKGFLGECGRRGGYMEVWNMNEEVQMQLYKLSSVTLCSNIDGQIMTSLMVDPPVEGQQSYESYTKEKSDILDSLKARALNLVESLNALEGVTCNAVEGALYAFPSIKLPAKAVEAAKKAGKAPDAYYCLKLLDETGVVVIPGSGFGQREGTFHFRTTILPPPDKIEAVTGRVAAFHKKFIEEHS
mmetsp:Transcript_27307/g.37998  ORF Transcript_27307/g.37998 Transcript_27307/m.37998 type:complete len:497 (-) Transcript_27307:409-1899(-)|eukprot:CAMPEP_0184487854 /NCGR_PEP_ID=MMETSP0113_2-20130426/10372_1 /TAXON_ID=91329 /ORGANISM="Norrisiella sphaerica, Strain BC52" /LENGTH=496 /DNA_ID=CAMNT_0026870271 /DNA_START=66 /DNA_END=1556 /DNA_ORIENTATION=+